MLCVIKINYYKGLSRMMHVVNNNHLPTKHHVKKSSLSVTAVLFVLVACQPSVAKDRVRVVGSSTVYPFAALVTEKMASKNLNLRPPIIESTGSGGGIKLFCAGIDEKTPDIVNSSRVMTRDEIADCAKNGVHSIAQMPIGYDGIVLLLNKKSAPLSLTSDHLYKALAAEVLQEPTSKEKPTFVKNPYKTWQQIEGSLPNEPIAIMGPPATSGTHDSLSELVVRHACNQALPEEVVHKNKTACTALRTDGVWIDAGENDNLLMQKIENQSNLIGIVGYNYFIQNRDKVQAININQSAPTVESIMAAEKPNTPHYPLARPLYFYVKVQNIGKTQGLVEYIEEFVHDRAIGANGYLVRKGLVPLEPAALKKAQEDIKSFKIVTTNNEILSSVPAQK